MAAAHRPPGNVDLEPTSAMVAWAMTPAGKVFRTRDGGRTWTLVWNGGQPLTPLPASAPPGLNRSFSAVLAGQGPSIATVIVQVSRGRDHARRTNFVTYRTTDGGRTWRPSVIRLPAG